MAPIAPSTLATMWATGAPTTGSPAARNDRSRGGANQAGTFMRDGGFEWEAAAS